MNPVTSIASLAYAGIMAEGIARDHVELVIAVSGFAAAVIGIVAWINGQIRDQIQQHAKQDEERHKLTLEKIDHLHELIEQHNRRAGAR